MQPTSKHRDSRIFSKTRKPMMEVQTDSYPLARKIVMKRYDRCARSFLFLASIGLLPVSAGYAQEVHKAARLPYTTSYQATAPMACATYYFFVNGSDPLHVGKLNQMTRRFDCLPNSHAEYFNMAQHHKIRQR